MSHFKKGDKVVCIESHNEGCFCKGDEFYVLDVRSNPCCNCETIDIGVEFLRKTTTRCSNCGARRNYDGNYFRASRFRKVDDTTHHSKHTIRNQSVLKKLSRLPHLVPERIEEGVEHA